ncbi:MAG: TIM barrel protein [Clostridia bacterium]|nr:TIM barrel protein [Clostridia bacterium]
MKFSAAGGWFGGDWYQNVERGAKYGFGAVEQLGWSHLDLARAKETLEKTGVTSTCIIIQSAAHPEYAEAMAWTHGMVWEDTHDIFVESFRETVEAAKIMNVPNICATVGNTRSDVCEEKQFENCVKTLKSMAHIAEEEGKMIVLEPLNVLVNHMGYFLVTTKQAVEMIRAVDSPNCKILFDIYHQQISEGNVIRNATENIELIGHFHIGDNPGRNEPGTGEINYDKVFRAIRDKGYDRYLAFECGRTVPLPELSVNMHALIDRYDEK